MGYTDDARALPALPSAKPSVRVALTRRNAGASDYIPREPAPYSVGLRCVCSYVCLRTYVERTSWLAVCVPRFGSTRGVVIKYIRCHDCCLGTDIWPPWRLERRRLVA